LYHYEKLFAIQSANLERRGMEKRQGQQPKYKIFLFYRVHPPKSAARGLIVNLPDKEATASSGIWTAGRNAEIL
jgi:hypothetical protein